MSILQTLERLEKLEKDATKGPWKYTTFTPNGAHTDFVVSEIEAYSGTNKEMVLMKADFVCDKDAQNFNLVSESRNALPELLAALREAIEIIKTSGYLRIRDRERAEEFLKKHGLDERGGE